MCLLHEFEDIDQGIRVFKGEEKGHIYGRFGNPTVDTVADKLAELLEDQERPIGAVYCAGPVPMMRAIALEHPGWEPGWTLTD